MALEFEKTMAILSGQTVDSFLSHQLTERDKTQIRNAIDLLFSGLSLRNWLAGGVLRDAWQNALDTLRDMIFEIPQNNPATTFMRNAVFEHRAKWHIQIIASRNADDLIKCPIEEYEQWLNNANTKINEATRILRQKVIDFDSGTPIHPVQTPETRNTSKMHTRGEYEREREHVREREK
ncbi:MAG: hypothetical protein IJY99_04830 [Alphaproteobacteria bacterium]|nr:hypothetical protein [Alphaproteobacteria bacterium]